jgi:hypothetical protein
MQAGHVVQLRTIYKSIVDGIGKALDFFEPDEKDEPKEKKTKADKAEKTEVKTETEENNEA